MDRRNEEETEELIKSAREGDRQAEQLLVTKFYPLVRSMARRYHGFQSPSVEAEDLEQVGYLGLLKALHKFDPSRGTRFSTFALVWVKGEILTYLRQGNKLIKTPTFRTRDTGSREGKNSGNTGAEVPLSETATRAGIPGEELAASDTISRVWPGGEAIEEAPSGENMAEAAIQKVWLKEALKNLDSLGRKVIFYRYFKEKTQQEAGMIIGLSQRQVSRVEKKVLSRMKEELGS